MDESGLPDAVPAIAGSEGGTSDVDRNGFREFKLQVWSDTDNFRYAKVFSVLQVKTNFGKYFVVYNP